MTPSIQQRMTELRMAELRIQQLHAEAAHARLVKEARAARRNSRGPSRFARLAEALRPQRGEEQTAAVASRRVPIRRTAVKSLNGC